MGTRNLTIVIHEGKTKVAQYGQWDGYPEGQGKIVLKFLRRCDLNTFREKLNDVSFLTQKEVTILWDECEMKGDLSEHPELSRDTAANILQRVYDGSAVKLWNRSKFVKDSLLCEWVYVIDLDQERFEIYTSSCKKPLTPKDRFYDGRFKKSKGSLVRIIGSYPLKGLPTVKQLIKDTTFELHKDLEQRGYNIIINHQFKQ